MAQTASGTNAAPSPYPRMSRTLALWGVQTVDSRVYQYERLTWNTQTVSKDADERYISNDLGARETFIAVCIPPLHLQAASPR